MKLSMLAILILALSACTGLQKHEKLSDPEAPTEEQLNKMNMDQIKFFAEKGNPIAIHILCYRNIYGYDGASKNYEEAYSWCQKGADTGNNSSQTLLAELYYFGNYVKKDYSKAFQFYKTAAESGHPHAQYILYFMYSRGQGTTKNNELAQHWLNRSASNGYPMAIKEVEQIKTEKRNTKRFLKKNES